VTDLLGGGPDRPPRAVPRRTLTVGALVILVVLGVRAGDGRAPRPVVSPAPGVSTPAAGDLLPVTGPVVRPDRTVGLVIDGRFRTGGTLEHRDPGAAGGPWTVAVRRRDGSLGTHGAVVTFPAPVSRAGAPVRVGRVAGRATPGAVSWPIAGAYARVRGDLTRGELTRLAAATTVTAGRPAVRAPAGFAVTAAGPLRAPTVREARYGSDELPGAAALGGLVYTGITTTGSFEDRLYAADSTPAGAVHGRPAVLSFAIGGSGALAWEPAPGIVAYVGYSGASSADTSTAVLHQLAQRTQGLSAQQWAATRPQVITQAGR
jgi:hypothetical protein